MSLVSTVTDGIERFPQRIRGYVLFSIYEIINFTRESGQIKYNVGNCADQTVL